MLGIAPIVYPSIRRGGPGGADLMVIDQSRAMSATLPSNRTGDAFGEVVMRTDCPLGIGACTRKCRAGGPASARWVAFRARVMARPRPALQRPPDIDN
jgi:hypothetical protein